jgi:glucose-6-phosphate isomerase
MQNRLTLDWTKVHDVVPIEKELSENFPRYVEAKKKLIMGDGPGHEFTGWLQISNLLDEWKRIQEVSQNIKSHSDAVVIIGIGGSYIGAKALYQAFNNDLSKNWKGSPRLFWAGHHLSTDEALDLLEVLDEYTPSIIVISKSGTTTEPSVFFRILSQYLYQRFGSDEAKERIFCVTDEKEGVLRKIAEEEGYEAFTIPANVGGRYSVFTSVGLLPLAVAGLSVEDFIAGANMASLDCLSESNHGSETHLALVYAALRNILYSKGYKVESLCSWTPKLHALGEWWKQLMGESDGKQGTGILPTSVEFTTDLHSLGQYFQDGERILFASHIFSKGSRSAAHPMIQGSLKIPTSRNDDQMQCVDHKSLEFVQEQAFLATILAHADGKVPTLVWELPEISPFWLGYWMYTQCFACAVGGYVRGINPFDQPGVEAYKQHMFALLGKKTGGSEIRSRLERGQRLKTIGLSTYG